MGKAQTAVSGANPVWPEHGGVLPTHSDVCLQRPTLPVAGLKTELANLNKRSPPPACVRAEIRHRREANRRQINKGNRFRKDRCNRLKSLKVTPTTPEGAYRYQEV